MKSQTSFTLHEFKGSWKEIGRQYGETCREEIKDMHEYWENALSVVMPDTPMETIVDKSSIFTEPIKAYAPEFMDEIEGIAEGAGISVNEVLFHQGSFEMDVTGPLYIGGCTSFAASGRATKNGKPSPVSCSSLVSTLWAWLIMPMCSAGQNPSWGCLPLCLHRRHCSVKMYRMHFAASPSVRTPSL